VPEPIRIRARIGDGITDLHVLMPHPMETGFNKDENGMRIPAHYITQVEITLSGRSIMAATFGRGVSQDPLLHVRFKGGKPGDAITVSWIDSHGERRTDEGLIAPA
jgi:sulfur-oxidizing protein SoxZ